MKKERKHRAASRTTPYTSFWIHSSSTLTRQNKFYDKLIITYHTAKLALLYQQEARNVFALFCVNLRRFALFCVVLRFWGWHFSYCFSGSPYGIIIFTAQTIQPSVKNRGTRYSRFQRQCFFKRLFIPPFFQLSR